MLDYPCFEGHYKMIAVDLSKSQAPDTDPRAIQQINFTENLDWAQGATNFLILEEAKKTISDL